MESELRRARAAALELFLIRRVVPLVWTEDEKATSIASGFLFARHGMHFLVSAHHCLKDLLSTPEKIGFPSHPNRPGHNKLYTLGGGHLVWAEKEDVAVFRLDREKAVERLYDGGWVFLGDDDVEREPTSLARVVAGWPAANVTQVDDLVTSHMTVLHLSEMAHPHPERVPPIDVYLEAPGVVADAVRGISGSPIWSVADDASTPYWDPSTALKLWAMEYAVKDGTFVRGACWGVVDEVIRRAALGPKKGGA